MHGQAPAAVSGRARAGGRPVRAGRGRLVAAEAAAGVALGGAVLRGAIGWTLLALAVPALLITVARRDGRWLTDVLAGRLRGIGRPAPGQVAAGRATPDRAARAGGVPALAAELGAVLGVVPRLAIADCTGRNGYPLGIAWDGQGLAAAVELDAGTPLRLDLGLLAGQAADDDVRLAGVQVLVEQLRVPALEATGFAPTAIYRRMAPDLPLVHRVWIALRYEPIWAPEAAQRRGSGGLPGGRLALAAALARLRVRLLGRGLAAAPLDAAALTRLLRSVGDPSPAGELRRDSWATAAGVHHCLAAAVTSPADWAALLAVAAASPVERTVLTVAADLDGQATRTRGAIRLVTTNAAAAAQARQQVLSTGLARALPDAQAAGVLATLPLGGGPRALASAIGWVGR
jgi:type VII secretion protein EccE